MKTLITLLVLSVFTSFSAFAASIEPSTKNNCGITIEGPIVAGDYDRFLSVAASEGFDGSDHKNETANYQADAVCLNSYGGSVSEGRLIARRIHEFGLPTRIEKDADCYSICAIMFMAGHMIGSEMDYPSRSLSVHASLGFHAPYFDLEDSSLYSADEVEDLTRLVSLIISDLIVFGSYSGDFDYQPAFSPVLMGEFLSYDHDETFNVDTIEKVARWRINLIDSVSDLPVTEEGIQQLCLNMEGWLFDKSATVKPSLSSGIIVSEASLDGHWDGTTQWYDVSTGGMEERGCLIRKKNTIYTSYFELCTYNNFNGVNLGKCPTHPLTVPAYYMLPGKTSISDLTSQ